MKLEKTCKVHGKLEQKDIGTAIKGLKKVTYLRCLICARKSQKKLYNKVNKPVLTDKQEFMIKNHTEVINKFLYNRL